VSGAPVFALIFPIDGNIAAPTPFGREGYVLYKAFQTDPQMRGMLGDHFLDKASLSPETVFQLWVQDRC